MTKVKFITHLGEIVAELRADAPKTVDGIIKSLPMKYDVILQCWGEEIFFFLPDTDLLLNLGYENAKAELEVGDVAFWPRDPACCLFFGRTPLSIDEKPVALEPVNVFGRVIEGVEILPKLKLGDSIRMVILED
jgi:hypothetical protein